MFNQQLAIPYHRIAEFCQRHYITNLSLFGSVLTDNFRDESDIDVLVEFDPNHIPGWEIVDIQDELSHIIGRNVDLHTYGSLSRHFRDKVVAVAQVIYERAG
ncbi:MAG: nucleotidyltransferase family protein [Anaerolineae bacterium]